MNTTRVWKTLALVCALSLATTGFSAEQARSASAPKTKAVAAKATPATPAASRVTAPNAEKKPRPLPFRGTLKAVDPAAKTLTISQRVFHADSDTKFFKEGQKAVITDGTVGQRITGSYRKSEAGKLIASTVYFGGKNPGKASPAKNSDDK